MHCTAYIGIGLTGCNSGNKADIYGCDVYSVKSDKSCGASFAEMVTGVAEGAGVASLVAV